MHEHAESLPPGERFERWCVVTACPVTRVEEPSGGVVLFFDVYRGPKAEMADADEVFGKHVEQKTTDEFDGVEGHRFLATGLGVIADHESDATVLKGSEPCVGDGDSVGISAEISKHRLGS